MRPLLFLLALLILPLQAELSFSDEPDEFETRQLYLKLLESPKHLYEGEIFSIQLRTIVTTDGYEAIVYYFANARGLKQLNPRPERRRDGRTYYDRFYFKVAGKNARLPDITPAIRYSNFSTISGAILPGRTLNVTRLNPPADFCGILADRFDIRKSKTTAFDKAKNVLVFTADANRSDLSGFNLAQAGTQSVESLENGTGFSALTYYAVLPSRIETLKFTYFNLQTHDFEPIRIPIEIEDDSVSTQSDLVPTEQGHALKKAATFGGIAAVALLIFLFRRRYGYLVIALAASSYALWLGAPLQHVCLRKDAPILLLPMRNATIFEIAPHRYTLIVEGHREGYTKVRLRNSDKIGWIRDEDICAP